MIIVEGSDLVGKTTFCEALLKDHRLARMGYMYSHLSRPPEQGFDGCQAYMGMAWENFVQDRFHLSEPIYSKVRGEEKSPTTSPEKFRLVDAHLRLMGVLTVVITATDELISSRFKENESREMYGLAKILHANRLYTSAALNGYIGEGEKVYKPDIDIVIACNDKNPFPTDATAICIVNAYMDRKDEVERAFA